MFYKTSNLIRYLLGFASVLLLSCNTNNIELLKIEDFAEQDIVNLIKINFLSQYGGIEKERELVCNGLSFSYESQNVDTVLNIGIMVSNEIYNLNMVGLHSVVIDEEWAEGKSLRSKYIDNGGSGSVSNGQVSQIHDLSSEFIVTSILENDESWTRSKTYRHITYTSELYTNLKAIFNISSNLCQFDFDNCALTSLQTFDFSFKLYDEVELFEESIYSGQISLLNNIWTLTFDNGNSFPLE